MDLALRADVNEVILCHKDLSRFGKLDSKELNHLCARAHDKGLKVTLEWDVIKTENDFKKMLNYFNELDLELISSVRVQDRGVLNWVFENTKFPIQLILEGSHHNLLAIKSWEGLLGSRLERLVLSIEISKTKLASYIEVLNTPVEILTLGRILLFYTPRNLLSSLKPGLTDEFLEAIGESEESPHKGFPLVENRHGTFMFHIKRLNLLKHLDELKEIGLSFARFDFRFDEKEVFKNILDLKFETYPHDSIKGFFNINKSDVLFKKLKNYRIQRKDSSYIGEVLEISSKSFIALKVKKETLRLNDKINFFTPDGKTKEFEVKSLRDSALNEVDSISTDGIAILTYLAGVSVKSQAYKVK